MEEGKHTSSIQKTSAGVLTKKQSREVRSSMIEYEEDQRQDNRGQDDRRQDDYPTHTEKIFSDRKIFFLDLKENDRGSFVKITEDVRGRRDTIMVPCEVLEDFIQALQNIVEADQEG